MINQIQELCPALESLLLSHLFLPFACLLCLQSASLDKSDFSKGELLPLLKVGSQGWLVGSYQLALDPGSDLNTWSNFAVMLSGFCEQDLRQAILISVRKFIISILCWSYIKEPWYQMHRALVYRIHQISEQTSFRLSGLERSFLRRTLLI